MFALLRDVVDSFNLQNITYCIATVGMFSLLFDKANDEGKYYMLHAFLIASIGLSLLYLFNYDKFVEDYDASKGLERSGWIDPNYFSCILGMGVLSSLILMIKYSHDRILMRCVYVVAMVVPLFVQVMLASRGGILAISVSISVLLLFSQVKVKYKILLIGFIACLISWMYSNGYFQLLEYRIQNDAGGGSGRLDIWTSKLNAFVNDGNIFHWIFGLGYQSGFELTAFEGSVVGFHNDFIALLCEYGIIGLFIFLYWLLLPIFRTSNENRPFVLSMLAYLILACCTLEPISSGSLTYFAFFFLLMLFTDQHQQDTCHVGVNSNVYLR